MRRSPFPLAVFAMLLALSSAASSAEDAPPQASEGDAAPAAQDAAPKEPELTPEEKAEKEARKACKTEICDILAARDPNGPDVSCDIKKTWRATTITNMLGGKIDWPWGNAVCQSKLVLTREALAKAMSEPKYEMALPVQKLRCTLAQKKDGEPYEIEVSIAPKVAFENGKAVQAKLNWGEASAPMLVYALIYAGTGLDNSANALGPEVVRMVNEFTTKKCAEVKAEVSGTKQD
jgi:hypothetical protein